MTTATTHIPPVWGWFPDSLPPPEPETAPADRVAARPTPRCWCCGRFARRAQYVMTRECERCAVRWIDPTPDEARLRDCQRANELAGILKRYGLAGEGYTDHAAVYAPCPA